ncbi:MAG: HEAT repeat domain-containing protein [Anaerolineae bacterium]
MTTPNKRIVTYLIARLQDKSRDIRLKSIAELSLIPDEDALNALKIIVEKDTDTDVRKAALEAARQIFIKIKEQESKHP